MIRKLFYLLPLLLPQAILAQETRVVAGVVVDAASGAPVADVLVTIQDTELRTVTDPEGRFRLAAVPIGSLRLIARHVAYGEHGQPLVVDARGPADFRIRISSQAIELQPLVVEVISPAQQARRASGNSLNVIERPTIDAYALKGETFANILREVPGIRVNRNCIEYRLGSLTTRSTEEPLPAAQDVASAPCRSVSIYVDGMYMPQGETDLLQSLALNDLERIEVLSPSEAGVRYLDSARGVLVVETRQGRGLRDGEREITVTGFGWDESQPYRWLRVLSVSALGTVATMAIARAALDCGEDEAFLPRGPMCSYTGGTGAGILTGSLGGLVTRWAGRTEISKGRALPSFVLGTATASLGYILWIRGEDRESDASRLAGHLVLGVGMPLTLTLSDRIFRVLR